MIDIGAGTGRDAAALATKGFEVIAVEPSAAMRAEGARLHPDTRVQWIDDRLPSLHATVRLGIAADVVLLSAVWMHVLPADRSRAFRKIVSLLEIGRPPGDNLAPRPRRAGARHAPGVACRS